MDVILNMEQFLLKKGYLMANKNKNSELSEVSAIRDILMGKQMAEYEGKFKELDAKLAAMEARLQQQQENAAKKAQKDLKSLEKELFQRLEKLEQLFAKNMSELDQKMEALSKADKVSLGEMLANLGEQLAKHKV